MYITDRYYNTIKTRQLEDEGFPQVFKKSDVAPKDELDGWLKEGEGDSNEFRLMNLMKVVRRGRMFGRGRGRANSITPFYRHNDGVNYISNQGNRMIYRPFGKPTSIYGLWRRPTSIYGDYSSIKRRLRSPDYY